MMTRALCCYILLLYSLGVSSETKLHAHRGNTVKLFSDIAVDKHRKISLYVYSALTAEWISEKSAITVDYIIPKYARRMYMDDNNSIWILCVDPNDAANYSIKYDSLFAGPKVELIVSDHLTQGVQVQMCLDDGDCIKTYLRNLTREQLLQLMDLHPEFFKAHCDIFRLICLGKRRLDMFWHSFNRNSNGSDHPGNSVPFFVRITDGSSLTAMEGESVTLTCTATGSGTIYMQWIGPSGAHLNTDMKYSVTTYNSDTKQSILKIYNLTRGDVGKYTCLGSMGAETQEDSTLLTVIGSIRNRWRRGGRLVKYALRWPHPTGNHLDLNPGETDRLLPDQKAPASDYAPFEFAVCLLPVIHSLCLE